MKGVFFDEDDAAAAVARLRREGYGTDVERVRFAGEDDDEDHPWAVTTDAPALLLELLVEEYDGWLEQNPSPAPPTPLELPDAPRRVKRPPRGSVGPGA